MGNEHFKIFEQFKWGISRKKHAIILRTEKEPKLNVSGYFEEKCKCGVVLPTAAWDVNKR